MEIRARSNESYAAHKVFYNLTTKKNPRINIFLKICLSILSALVLLMTLFFDRSSMPLAIFVVIGTLLCFFIDILLPRINYKLTKVSSGLKDSFIFYDNEIHITTESKNLTSESDLGYDVLKKVYETNEYFFLYISHSQAYIVDKSTVSGGSENELRTRLFNAVEAKKYKVYYK